MHQHLRSISQILCEGRGLRYQDRGSQKTRIEISPRGFSLYISTLSKILLLHYNCSVERRRARFIMPIGTPYKSFILPYPIRVDDFTSLPDSKGTAALHLLTHTHTDHLNGLSARSFAQIVVCSYDAKEMLLRHEVYAERFLKEQEIRAENVRTFSHLKIDPTRTQDGAIYYTGARDLLVSSSSRCSRRSIHLYFFPITRAPSDMSQFFFTNTSIHRNHSPSIHLLVLS